MIAAGQRQMQELEVGRRVKWIIQELETCYCGEGPITRSQAWRTKKEEATLHSSSTMVETPWAETRLRSTLSPTHSRSNGHGKFTFKLMFQ